MSEKMSAAIRKCGECEFYDSWPADQDGTCILYHVISPTLRRTPGSVLVRAEDACRYGLKKGESVEPTGERIAEIVNHNRNDFTSKIGMGSVNLKKLEYWLQVQKPKNT